MKTASTPNSFARPWFFAIVALALFLPAISQAQITFNGVPGTAVPPATLGPYTMTAFAPDVRPGASSCPLPFVTGIPSPLGGTITTSTPTVTHVTGNGLISGHAYLGDFYAEQLICSGPTPETITFTMPANTGAFYMYVAANLPSVSATITGTSGAATSGPIVFPVFNGARYYGFYAAPGQTLTSITLTGANTLGLIFGEFGIASCIQPVITQNPSDQTVCEGSSAFFFVNGTGFSQVQWQRSTDNGTTWNNIPGAVTQLLQVSPVAYSQNGYQYQAILNPNGCPITTTAATLTVWTTPLVTLHPVPLTQTLCEGTTLTYISAATATPAPTVQWQKSVDGGATFTDIIGATNPTYSTTVTAGMNNNIFRAKWTNPCNTVFSNSALLNVNLLPVVTTQPLNQTVCAPTAVSFTTAATGTPIPTVQWQQSLNGGSTWTNIPGATSTTLSIPTTTTAMYNSRYRAVWTNSCGSSTSLAVSLFVHDIPIVSAQPTDQTVCAPTAATFSSDVAAFGATTATWQMSTDNGGTWANVAGPTPVVSQNNYTVSTSNGASIVPGTTDIGNHCDDCNTTVALPFPYTFYDQTYNNVNLASNGSLQFVSNNASFVPSCLPDASMNYAIIPHWDDLMTTFGSPTLGIFTSVSGVAPNRIFNIEWHTNFFSNTTQEMHFQVRLYEGKSKFDFIYGSPLDRQGSGAVIGIQKGTGASSSYDYSCFLTTLYPGMQLTYEAEGTGTSTYTTPATTSAMSGYKYRAAFTNICGTTNSNAATLTVNTAPVVTTNPVNQTVCAPATATFTAAASGIPTPTVQWQLSTNGGGTFTNIAGATSLSYTTGATTTAMSGYQYRAVFTNSCASATTTAAVLTVNQAPAVTANPTNLTVCAPATATFTAAASGTPVPTVQWQLSTNGGVSFADIAGATSLSYTTGATTTAMSGYQYHAVFTNSCGTATTTAAILTVNIAPAVTSNPANQSVCAPATATFTAAASGTPVPTVQWQLSTNGGGSFANIVGATSLSYTTGATTTAMSGYQYRAVFTNSCGTVTTTAAILTVNEAPTVTTNPTNVTLCAPATATFTSAATGTPAPTVQWELSTNGGTSWAVIPGATSASYTTPATTGSMNGYQYHAVWTNVCGTVTSTAAILTVNTAPIVTLHPVNTAVCLGATGSFTSSATGTPTPTMQWQLSADAGVTWTNIAGATTSPYTFTVSLSMNGYWYRAQYTNSCGITNSNPAILTVNVPPAVTLNPLSQTVCAPTTATFTAAGSGTPAPTVQWQLSTNSGTTWADIGGATATSYTTPATATAMSGYQYRAVFTNVCSFATTAAATLTVNIIPSITTQPLSQTVCAPATATFTSAGTGTPAPTIQWQLSTDNGVTFNNIIGATSASYTSSATTTAMSGYQYRAQYTNTCGTTNSNAAILTVNIAPAVTSNPSNTTVCAPATATFTAAASGTPVPTVQWQLSTDGGTVYTNIAGATSTSYTTGATTTAMTNYRYRAVFTNSCGSATTAAGILTVNIAPTVTTNPTNQFVCAGGTATFSAAATGTPAPTVQWQQSINGGVTWTDIAGATSTTYAFTVLASQNGYMYRAVFTNSCGTATTTAATLSTNAPVVITTNPVSQTVCAPATATFTSAATGNPAPTVQWQLSTNSGSTWTNISGATSSSYTTGATTTAMSGYQYRAAWTNPCGTVNTTAAILTVNIIPSVTTNPVSQAVCAPGTVTFTTAGTGQPAPTIQWQQSTNSGTTWTNISGATSTSYTTPATTFAMNGYQYRAAFTNSCGTTNSTAATLTVNTAPTITCPANLTAGNDPGVCGRTVTMSPTVTGSPAPTVVYKIGATTISNPYFFPKGTTIVDVTATNLCGSANCSFSITINDTEAPALTAPAPVTVNTEPGLCTCRLSVVPLGTPIASDNCGIVTVTNDAPAVFPLGVTIVTWTAKDPSNNTTTRTQTVTVRDQEPPNLYAALNPTFLYPPNQTMRPIVATVTASDNCPGAQFSLVSVTSSEPDAGVFPGDLPNDIVAAPGVSVTSFAVRAERSAMGRIYTVRYSIMDANGNSNNATYFIGVLLKEKMEEDVIPKQVTLEQNFPNPFNPTTSITYGLPEDGTVRMNVYDMLSRKVATIVDTYQKAGTYTVQFNASEIPSGMYFYTLEANGVVLKKTMNLVK